MCHVADMSDCLNLIAFVAEAFHEVSKVFQRIEDNTRRHENHLQLCRVQKLLKGKKTKILTAGKIVSPFLYTGRLHGK